MTNEPSPEQQIAISQYCQEWRKKLISTEALDRDRAKQIIEQSYLAMGKEIPNFLFCESPFRACQIILEKLESKEIESQQLQWNLLVELLESLPETKSYLRSKSRHVFNPIFKVFRPWMQLSRQLIKKLNITGRNNPLYKAINYNFYFRCNASLVNFINSTSQATKNIERWQIIKSILTSCDYIFAFDSFCIICDRPIELNFDDDGFLHAEGKPAMLFPDGYALYSYHNQTLPEQYGKLHLHQWSIKFFLEEKDPIRQEILARELDLIIDRLTPEQENCLYAYVKKWCNINTCTQPLSHFEIEKNIKKLYSFFELKPPRITIFNSPLQLFEFSKKLSSLRKKTLDLTIFSHDLYSSISSQTTKNISQKLMKVFHPHLMITRQEAINFSIAELQEIHGYIEYTNIGRDFLSRGSCTFIDYCINVLNCICDREAADIFLAIAPYFEQIFPTEEVCFVCDRPRSISLDSNHIIHAEGKPAIQYADGFSVYVHHGTRIPEKYGKYPPSQWRSQWLLSEENAEIRRVLIQEIGYAKICRELQARELDSWQDYSLLGIDFESEESIHLLKMVCPSTEDVHVLRVPPTMYSAREAIAWVNWGIDPEEFSVQT